MKKALRRGRNESEDIEVSSVSSKENNSLINGDDEDSDIIEETPAQKRVRLANEYLQAIKEDNKDDDDIDMAVSRTLEKDALIHSGKMMFEVSSLISKNEDYKLRLIPIAVKSVTSLALYRGTLFVGSKDCSIYKYDFNSEAMVKYEGLIYSKKYGQDENVKGHRSPILSLAVSPGGRYLASGSEGEKYVFLWDINKDELIYKLKGHRDGITSLSFQREKAEDLNDEMILFSSSKDRSIRVWDVVSRSSMDELYGHQSEITEIDCLSAKRLVSCSQDLTTRYWKIPEQSQLLFSQSHMFSIDCIAFISDTLFVSGSQDGKLKLWSVHKKKPAFSIEGHKGKGILSVARLTNSDIFASASENEIKFWKLDFVKNRIERCVTRWKVKGFVNSLLFDNIQETDNVFTFKLLAGIGSEPRFGRWRTQTGVKGEVIVYEFVLDQNAIVEESDFVSSDDESATEPDGNSEEDSSSQSD